MPVKGQRKTQVGNAVKDNDLLDKDALYEIADDADRYHDLKVMLDSAGGEALIESLLTDVTQSMEHMAANYRTLPLQDFIGLSARINTSLSLVRTITRAAENLKGAEELLHEKLRE